MHVDTWVWDFQPPGCVEEMSAVLGYSSWSKLILKVPPGLLYCQALVNLNLNLGVWSLGHAAQKTAGSWPQ